MRLRSLPSSVASALAAVLLSGPAAAAEVQVNPTQVDLSPSSPSAIVTLRNGGAEPVSFEVQVRAWRQTVAGEMDLSDTEDVVAFPPVLAIAPGEERNLRVGVATPFGSIERSYRVFIQELPAPEKPGAQTHLRVLTRIGLPVFLAPRQPVVRATVEGLEVRAGRAVFTVHNRGTVHLRASSVKLAATDADGKLLLESDLQAWYLLAVGERDYQVEIPREICARVREVRVTVAWEREVVSARKAAPEGACAR